MLIQVLRLFPSVVSGPFPTIELKRFPFLFESPETFINMTFAILVVDLNPASLSPSSHCSHLTSPKAMCDKT